MQGCMRAPPAAHHARHCHPVPSPPRSCPLPCRQKLVPYIGGTGQIRNETVRQILAEFWGTLLFELFGGSAPSKDTSAPAANGFALVAVSESCVCVGRRTCTWHGRGGGAPCVDVALPALAVRSVASARVSLLTDCRASRACVPLPPVYAFANISGGHLNPAVSFALMCTGHMKWWKALMYMVAQVRYREGVVGAEARGRGGWGGVAVVQNRGGVRNEPVTQG